LWNHYYHIVGYGFCVGFNFVLLNDAKQQFWLIFVKKQSVVFIKSTGVQAY